MKGHTFGIGDYRVRDGRRAEVLFVAPDNHKTVRRLIGYIVETTGCYVPACWYMCGGWYREGTAQVDLMPPIETRQKFVYPNGGMSPWVKDAGDMGYDAVAIITAKFDHEDNIIPGSLMMMEVAKS